MQANIYHRHIKRLILNIGEMRIIDNLKLRKTNKTIFKSKSYKVLNRVLIVVYVLFMLVYMFRGNLYKLGDEYISLFAEPAPNLIPSFLFTLIGIFYIVPFFKGSFHSYLL